MFNVKHFIVCLIYNCFYSYIKMIKRIHNIKNVLSLLLYKEHLIIYIKWFLWNNFLLKLMTCYITIFNVNTN